MFFFIRNFFFKYKNPVVYKSFPVEYHKQLQTTPVDVLSIVSLFSCYGVVAAYYDQHPKGISARVLFLKRGFFYKTGFCFFYKYFYFWAQSSPHEKLLYTTQQSFIALLMYNQQQHKKIHTLQPLHADIPKSQKKSSKYKTGKTLKHASSPTFSSFIGRSAMILPQHVGHVFFVHNGKTYNSVSVSPKMLGHKFGEFASTRKKPFHRKKK